VPKTQQTKLKSQRHAHVLPFSALLLVGSTPGLIDKCEPVLKTIADLANELPNLFVDIFHNEPFYQKEFLSELNILAFKYQK